MRRGAPRDDEVAAARAVRAGAAARSNGIALSACPYPGELQRFWRMGWDIRNRAHSRWIRQAEEVDETLRRAAPYIDEGAPPDKLKPSQAIGLHFFASGSFEPDEAYRWFLATMKLQREKWRRRVAGGGEGS